MGQLGDKPIERQTNWATNQVQGDNGWHTLVNCKD